MIIFITNTKTDSDISLIAEIISKADKKLIVAVNAIEKQRSWLIDNHNAELKVCWGDEELTVVTSKEGVYDISPDFFAKNTRLLEFEISSIRDM